MTNGNQPPSPEAAALLSAQGDPYSTPSTTPVMGGGGGLVDSWFLRFDSDRLELPGWWSRLRDMRLRQFTRQSTILSSVVYQRAAQNKNTPWHIEVEDERAEPMLPFYHDLINLSQFGAGFRSFMELYTQDLLCQDNGGFIELIGDGEEFYHTSNGVEFYTKGYLPKWNIRGFAHIDAAQIWRTNNQDFPYIYTNPWTGKQTIFHWSRCVGISQLSQPIERGRGIGFCAVSRAFTASQIMDASNLYVWEKLTGQSPEIAIAKGVALKAIQQAVADGAVAADNNGTIRYKGVAFVQGDVMQNLDPDIKIVGLKGVPDGTDREQEMTLGIYMIAMAFGTDVRDLGWAAQYAGDTKADAEIQDQKTSNRGRADVLRDIEFIMNTRILPPGLSFVFDAKDDLEDLRRAEIANLRAQTRALQITSGELRTDEARELAARDGDIDPEFIVNDVMLDETSNPIEQAEFTKAIADKAYSHTRSVFLNQMSRNLRRLRRTEDSATFLTRVTKLFNAYGTRAYLEGLIEGGAAGIKLGDLSDEERLELSTLINAQLLYAQQVNPTSMATPESADYRASLWATKGLDGIYNAGLLAARENQNLKWIFDDVKKHCVDCAKLDGRVYRKSIWKKYEIQPQSSALACEGWLCGCKLVPTKEKVTPGRPPKLVGSLISRSGKKEHDHDHDH